MRLVEANRVMRLLAKRRIRAGLASDVAEDGSMDFVVMVNPAGQPDGASIDLGELGMAAWVAGFRAVFNEGGIVTFEVGPYLLENPERDHHEPAVYAGSVDEQDDDAALDQPSGDPLDEMVFVHGVGYVTMRQAQQMGVGAVVMPPPPGSPFGGGFGRGY